MSVIWEKNSPIPGKADIPRVQLCELELRLPLLDFNGVSLGPPCLFLEERNAQAFSWELWECSHQDRDSLQLLKMACSQNATKQLFISETAIANLSPVG